MKTLSIEARQLIEAWVDQAPASNGGDYKGRASDLDDHLRQKAMDLEDAAEWSGTALTAEQQEAVTAVKNMPDGYNCPRGWLDWWSKFKSPQG